MSPWKKNIAVKLPPFWSWSETCRNFGHVTLTCWVFSRAFWAGIFVQKFVESVSKNILLDIDEFQAEEASSLLILKAIFLSKCHTNILSWPIHELHISRGNIFFAVDFLFDQWNQLRLMFFLLPFYTFHLESYLCHTNTGLLCMATGKQSSLTGAMQIHEVHEEEKPSNWPLLQGSRNQGEQEKILCYPFFGWRLGINHCSISLYHYIIKSS